MYEEHGHAWRMLVDPVMQQSENIQPNQVPPLQRVSYIHKSSVQPCMNLLSIAVNEFQVSKFERLRCAGKIGFIRLMKSLLTRTDKIGLFHVSFSFDVFAIDSTYPFVDTKPLSDGGKGIVTVSSPST
jgi:hypothetical protein